MFLDNNHYVVLRMIKATFQSGIEIGRELFLETILHVVPYPKIERWLRQRGITGTWVEQCLGRTSLTVAFRQCEDTGMCPDVPAF